MTSTRCALLAFLAVSAISVAAQAEVGNCSRGRGAFGIGDALLWFSPETLHQETDGAPVDRWQDCSGNNFDAVQPSPPRQPVLRQRGIGPFPVLEFDGVNDVLKLTGDALLHNITLFIVYRYHAAVGPDCAHTYPFSLGDDLNITGHYWGIETLSPCSGSSPDVADIYAGFSNDARATLPGISAAGVVNQMTAISRGFIHDTEVWVNGEPAAMSPTGVTVPLTVSLSGSLEGSWNGIGGGTFPGDNKAAHVQIAEIILFDKAVTAEERERVERYLRGKYLHGTND